MTPDQTPPESRIGEFSVFMRPRHKRPGLGARHVLFAGVAGACLLGAGLGLWARPAMHERQASATLPANAAPPKAPAAARTLQIIVDDRPAPIGAPIDVLPANPEARPQILPPAPTPVLAPTRPPEGLMRVQDVTPPAPPPAAPHAVAKISRPVAPTEAKPHVTRDLAAMVIAALASPKPDVVARAEVTPKPEVKKPKAVLAKAKPAAPVHLAKAPTMPKAAAPAKPARAVELARAAAAKAAAHKLELAQAAKEARAERQEELRLAKVQKQEQLRLAANRKQEKDRLAKGAKLHQIELARAEAKGRAEARAEALAQARDDARKQVRLASLARAGERALPHEVKPHAPPPVEIVKSERRHAGKARRDPKVEQASLKTRKAPRFVEPAYRARAVPVAPPPPQQASGLMKASTQRCSSRDAGEALVCADPSLGAADRQLTRAYQGARAAGVPEVQLQRQQQRWLSARSAAAREAPWAVHDVYLARIAELNGLAKEAHGNGY
jgi:hypothetical protein